ncbi:MAG TPA: hypothetical protein P5214_10325, partial [Rectinema sp.]|nr:hypothetical protein [Rectinema sp.]
RALTEQRSGGGRARSCEPDQRVSSPDSKAYREALTEQRSGGGRARSCEPDQRVSSPDSKAYREALTEQLQCRFFSRHFYFATAGREVTDQREGIPIAKRIGKP